MTRHLMRLGVMVLGLGLVGCTIIRPGEIGVKQRLGKLEEGYRQPGPVAYNPFVAQVVKLPTRTVNLEIRLSLPSAEGLNIQSEISILYRIDEARSREILEEVGLGYESVVILSTFRSAAADVAAQFMAKDMYTAERAAIEEAIRERMMEVVGPRVFTIEAVLMKSIQLPTGLARAIEAKLEAEQEAQRMTFVLEQERLEAERKKIEAAGVRDSQAIISESLDDSLLRFNSIQAFRELATSPNAKVIVAGGDNGVFIDAGP